VRAAVPAFAGLAAFATDEMRAEVDGRLEQVFAQVASDNYFALLGVRPAAGRLLVPGDERLDPPVAVIGHGYWQRRFGGDPTAIGRSIIIGATAFTIVGVTPKAFAGLDPGRRVDVTVPITQARPMMGDPGAWWFEAVGRLRPGTKVGEATARADTVFQAFMRDWPGSAETRQGFFRQVVLEPASHGLGGLRAQFATPLAVMAAIGAIVLFIACANLGSLLIARGEARSREMAVRIATGAGVGRLIRQLLTETLVLFVLGTLGGLLVSRLALQGVLAVFAGGRRPLVLDVPVDWRFAAFVATIMLVAAAVTGLWPALRAIRTDPHLAMKNGETRVAGSHRATAAARLLVASQVAMSLVLVTSAVLFGRTMWGLRGVDLGFRADHVLTMSVDLVLPGQAADVSRPAFFRQLLHRVDGLPGVRAASLSVLTPLSGRDTFRSVTTAGFEPVSDEQRVARLNHVSEAFFRTFDIPIVAGRAFTSADTGSTRKVAVINAEAARLYFPGRSPVGETIGFGPDASYEIVGVAGNYKHRTVREDAARMVFLSTAQPLTGLGRLTLSVASDRPSAELAAVVAAEVRQAHPRALVSDVVDISQQIDATLISERLLSRLAGGLATLALVLASVGLYGTLSYSVARRRTEIGVRMALGAKPRQVAADVVRQALRPVAAGLLGGLPVAMAVGRAAESQLFGVAPLDVATYLASIVLLAAVALAASWAPARRAASIAPVDAIRAD
jgi:predicted permease